MHPTPNVDIRHRRAYIYCAGCNQRTLLIESTLIDGVHYCKDCAPEVEALKKPRPTLRAIMWDRLWNAIMKLR